VWLSWAGQERLAGGGKKHLAPPGIITIPLILLHQEKRWGGKMLSTKNGAFIRISPLRSRRNFIHLLPESVTHSSRGSTLSGPKTGWRSIAGYARASVGRRGSSSTSPSRRHPTVFQNKCQRRENSPSTARRSSTWTSLHSRGTSHRGRGDDKFSALVTTRGNQRQQEEANGPLLSIEKRGWRERQEARWRLACTKEAR